MKNGLRYSERKKWREDPDSRSVLERLGRTRQNNKTTHLIIHVWAVKLCVSMTFLAGMSVGFLLGVLVVVNSV